MKRLTNTNIKKEFKSKILYLILGVLLIIGSVATRFWYQYKVDQVNKNKTDLNSVIISNGDRTLKKSYVDIKTKPYQFAVYDNTLDSYYIVSDGTFLYVVYMSRGDFYKLNKDSITEKAIRVEGITKETPSDVKKLAIDAYNKGQEKKDKLKITEFDKYFGSVYLDLTVSDSIVAGPQLAISILLFITGIIIIIVYIIEIRSFNKGLKRLEDHEVAELNAELDRGSAFYYKKAHLYLTDNFILNFGGLLRIIKYSDILWMYKYEQRTNGIKTTQSIKVVTKDGKTKTIANMELLTKAKKEVFDEILTTIASKNSNILLGYTKENIALMKEKIKEIKRNKKNGIN